MISSQNPEEAANALADVRQAQDHVIDAVLVPAWYWWVIAAGCVAIGAAADYHHPVVLAVTIPVAVIAITSLTFAMIFGAYRGVRVRDADLLGPRGAIAILTMVWSVIGITLGVAFGLRALGSPAPATIGTAVGGVLLILAGPPVMGYLRRLMRSNRAGM
jgi:hypothetical protein